MQSRNAIYRQNQRPGLLALGLLVLWMFCGGIGQAQDTAHQVLIGEEVKDSYNSAVIGVIPQQNQHFLVLRVRNNDSPQISYYLDRYDMELNRLHTAKLPISIKDARNSVVEMLAFGSQNYIFTTQDDNKLKRLVLNRQQIDSASLRPLAPKKVTEVPLLTRQDRSEFSFRMSPDSSKLLVYYDLPYQKGERERFGFLVFDEQFNVLADRTVKLPYDDELFLISGYKVDNKGGCYISGILYEDKVQDKRKGKSNYQYLVLAYAPGSMKARQYVLNLDEQFISDMQYEVDRNGNLICVGFYSDKGPKMVKGTFYLKLDGKTGKLLARSQEELNPAFMEKFMSEKQVEKGQELQRYKLHELIPLDNGRTILLAEQQYVTAQTYSAPDRLGVMFSQSTYTYHFKDIIVISMDQEGKIEWSTQIPKVQITTDDGGDYSSFLPVQGDNVLYLLYNDNFRNRSVKDSKVYRFSNESSSVLTMITVDEKGSWTREPLVSFKDFKSSIQARHGQSIANEQIIFFGNRGRNKRYARVRLSDLEFPKEP